MKNLHLTATPSTTERRMSTDEKIKDCGATFLTRHAREFTHILSWAESPIERLFLAAMLAEGWDAADRYEWAAVNDWYKARYGGPADKALCVLTRDDCCANCVVQLQTRLSRRPRIDFAFVERSAEKILVAVELDGHDFHEKTKQQASRDKARERVLVDDGWRVVRFTGSDVYRDPSGVVEEVVSLVNKLVAGGS